MLGQLVILAHVALAIVLGGVIGLDREISDKPAGLRTNMLVAAAAALLVSLGNVPLDYFTRGGNNIQADPIRILGAVSPASALPARVRFSTTATSPTCAG